MRVSKTAARVVTVSSRLVVWLEAVVATVLVVIIALGVVALVMQLYSEAVNGEAFFGPGSILRLLDLVLIIFIVVELFNIAVAYMQHRSVVPTVLEAALVAVARKVVVSEIGTGAALSEAAGLAIMLLTIAVAWYLLRKAGVTCALQCLHAEEVEAVRKCPSEE